MYVCVCVSIMQIKKNERTYWGLKMIGASEFWGWICFKMMDVKKEARGGTSGHICHLNELEVIYLKHYAFIVHYKIKLNHVFYPQ